MCIRECICSFVYMCVCVVCVFACMWKNTHIAHVSMRVTIWVYSCLCGASDYECGASKMVQQVKALATKPDNLSLIHGIHV